MTGAPGGRSAAGGRDLGPALYRAALALGRTRDAAEVVRVAITETQRAAGLEAVALYVFDAERRQLVLDDSAGMAPDFRERTRVLAIHDAGPVARAIGAQDVVTVPVEELQTEALRAAFADHGFRLITVAPVAGQHEVLGVLYLASRELHPLSPGESSLVHAIGGLVGVALENAALRDQILAQQERLRALAGGVLQAREAEARRIAHELHDEAGQVLAGLHIALDRLEWEPWSPEIHAELDRVEAQLRRLSRELRPTMLDDLGLAAALEWLAQGVTERAGVAITVDALDRRLAPEVETALYRIVQEALSNAVRHGRARRVHVQIREDGRHVRAVIRDDGRGFDVGAAWGRRGERGLGLIGIRERAEALGGSVEIRSAPDTGTELSVTIGEAGP
jgi:signal transduction histidine kinase